jgi:hypothetical protein
MFISINSSTVCRGKDKSGNNKDKYLLYVMNRQPNKNILDV